jgi:hypothetical protein
MKPNRWLIRMLVVLLAVALPVGTAPLAVYAAGVTVSGSVSNDQNLPVPTATVAVLDPSTGQVIVSTTTGVDGSYALLIEPGTYDLQAIPPSGSAYTSSVTKGVSVTTGTRIDFVLVAPQQMATQSGRLLNSLGEPLPGLTVDLTSSSGGTTHATSQTDVEGRYQLTVPPGEYQLTIRQFDNDWTQINMPLNFYFRALISLAQSRTQDLVMPFKRITLTVTDTSGNPVQGAVVTTDNFGVPLIAADFGATSADGLSSYSLYEQQVHELVTDATGHATLWHFAVPSYLFALNVTPPAGAELAPGGLRVDITQDTALSVVLQPAVSLSGRLTNGLDEPMANQELSFSGSGHSQNIRTDAQGNYEAQLEPGRYSIYIMRNGDKQNHVAGHFPENYEVVLPDVSILESRVWDLKLPLRRISVHVQDPNGNPVSNASLRTFWFDVYASIQDVWSSGEPFGISRTVGSVSRYDASNVFTDPSGDGTLYLFTRPSEYPPYTISAQMPNSNASFTGGSVVTRAENDESLTIIMQPSVTLSGKLLSPDGNGLPGQYFVVVGPNGSVNTGTDAAGNYALNVSPGLYGFRIGGSSTPTRAPNEYSLMAYHTAINTDRHLDITLPEHRVRVKVQDPAGAPVAGVRLTMPYTTFFPIATSPFDAAVTANFTGGSNYSEYSPAVSDQAGEATLWLLDNGLSGQGYSLTATPPPSLPFLPISMTNLTVTEDRDLVIVLQFAHGAPTTTAVVTGPQNEPGHYTGQVTVTLSAFPGAGYTLATTFYQFDAGNVQIYTGPFQITTAGTHTIRYWSKDTTGVTETPKTLSLTLDINQPDTTPPTVSPTVTPEATVTGWHSSDVSVHWTVTDPESAIATTCEDVSLTAETDGQTLTCQSTNSAGLSSTPVSVTIKIDRTAPVTRASKSSDTVTLTATDNLSGVLTTFYQVDGGETRSGNTVSITEPGTHRITYWSADQAANLEEAQSLDVTINPGDKTPPVTTAEPPAPTDWVREWTLRLTATDDDSGVAVTYVTGYGPMVTYADPGLTLDRTGIWDLQYWSVDAAGNAEAPHHITPMIDHHGPFVWATGGLTPDGIRVFLAGEDQESGMHYLEWSLNHETWQRYTGPFLLPSTFSGRLYYRGFDRLGNVTECVVDIVNITSDGDKFRVCGNSAPGSTVTVAVTDVITGQVYQMDVPTDANGDWCVVIIVPPDCTCRINVGGGVGEGVIIDVKPPRSGGGVSPPKCECGWYGGGEPIVIDLEPDDGGGSGATKIEIDTGGGGGWVEVPIDGGGGSYTIPPGTLGGGGHDIRIRTTDGAGNSGIETIHVDIDDGGPELGEPIWEPGSDRPTFHPVDGGSGLGGDDWWDELFDSHCGCIIQIYHSRDKTGNESTFKLYPVPVEAQRSFEGEQKLFSLGNLSVIPGTGPWTAKVWWGDDSQPEPFPSTDGALARTHTYKDNGQYTAMVLVFNRHLQGALIRVPITVENLPPEITKVTGPTAPQLVGTAVTLNAAFHDPGILDSHTATIDWSDGTAPDEGTVNETLNTSGTGTVTFHAHTYSAPGVYTVKITVTDKDGASDEAFYTYVVVYDRDGGFVTGGGWIKVAAGSYPANPKLSVRANFGFNAKYKKGATQPTGQTEFQVADLNFHSTEYEWLVVAGARAQYKGTGTINGGGSYGFLLTVIDGQVSGGGTDRFRIKIWDLASGAVIFDNQMGADETGDASTALSGGSIVIHSGK